MTIYERSVHHVNSALPDATVTAGGELLSFHAFFNILMN